jgi:adenylate cyclase class IV
MPGNREIEVKLMVRDLRALVRRLRAMGARRVGRVFEQNALFDMPDEYFRKHQSILRIRIEENVGHGSRHQRPGIACAQREQQRPSEDGRYKGPAYTRVAKDQETGCEGLLTFKCPQEGSRSGRRIAQSRYKEREEIEYRLPDARRFERLLERLGLRVWFRYEKYRTHYRVSGSALKIDLDETPIGTFLELEGSRRSIDGAAKALGYRVREYITASYLELYASDCARRGISVANMVFASKKNANLRTLRLTKFPSALNK